MAMDFRQAFLNALQSNTVLTKSFSIRDYLPDTLAVPDDMDESLPYVQAYGNIQSSYPYYYEISGLDSYCLLYTESGSGTLATEEDSFTLTPGTLAFIDCRQKHKVVIRQSPWTYKVFFLTGNPAAYLYDLIIKKYGCIHTISLGSDIPDLIKKFFAQLVKHPERYFLMSKFILDILLETIMEKTLTEDSANPIPDYLISIKNNFDGNYQKNYTLATLEQEYRISRYRICREFTEYFNLSPIQYLNRRRIAVAKEALIETDRRINEIGRMVGIENTNHFIRLFKKQTGVTPLDFRRKPPADTFF